MPVWRARWTTAVVTGCPPRRVPGPPLDASSCFDHERCVFVEPALQLADRNQSPAAAANDAQLLHNVLLEEVDADAKGVGCLTLREREATEHGPRLMHALVIEREPRGRHAPTSRNSARTHPCPWRVSLLRDSCGIVRTRVRRSPAASSGRRTASPPVQRDAGKWLVSGENTVL